ncbi:MAG TPA: hypothetical protein VJ279_08465 [Hanamia sp.]|jgi:P22 coat protein - gene protein 5.|nr:hypothetical protein [Hanamia sp.]
MPLPNNILQNVQTYNKADLAYLQNINCFVSTANTKYRDFQKANPANLGDTITFDKPPRFIANDGLVVSFQGVEQRVQSLTVDKSKNIGIDVSAQQLIFNLEDYMDRFGRGAINELGAVIEADIAGICETSPYRFYGNGVTPINSFNQLGQMMAFFRNFGAAKYDAKVYMSDIVIPDIIGSGLNQFVPGNNEELRNSWELGAFNKAMWYTSNLLPEHIAGSEGQAGVTLTVVSTTTNADGGVITITFSGTSAASDADSVKIYDRFQFQDNVAGHPNIRFRTFEGHHPSACPVQFKATANAASTGASQVTVSIDPPLQAAVGKNQNITQEIVAGMQVKVLPSHRVGMVQSGNQFYVAIPPLPDCDPFMTSVQQDPETGVALRLYTGAQFGQNLYGTVHDAIWGKTQVSDNAMAVIFPL